MGIGRRTVGGVVAVLVCACSAQSQERTSLASSAVSATRAEMVSITLGAVATNPELRHREVDPRQTQRFTRYYEENGREIRRAIERVYSERFTSDELRALSAFYSTDVGRAIAQKQEALIVDLALIGEVNTRNAYGLNPAVPPPVVSPIPPGQVGS